ncbi:MAG: hypothetical protein EOM66_04190 [Clostridia bacterium]|nr:hypothetical protein [Clostridia bacterium]
MRRRRVLTRYYKRKLYGGRSSFARMMDFISLRVIGLLVCYLHFSTIISNVAMAGLMSIVAVAFGSVAIELAKSMRMDRFIRKERQCIAMETLKKRLLIMPRDEQLARLRRYAKANPARFKESEIIFTLHRTSPVMEDDVLAAASAAKKRGAESVTILHTGPVDGAAKSLAADYVGSTVSFLALEDILSQGDRQAMLPTEEEIDSIILAREGAAHEKRKKALSRPFERGRTGRYLLCALGLFAASFFVRYPLYYRLMAAACVSFGAMAYALGQADNNTTASR